ncbi:type I-U CRISPR-associated protein Csb2 [Lentzea sp. NPDC004782]|uniref:type I-G CRISPR-associated protein Csb2 n=1 Tax=Lentzea sp. NPDC004782 TaxID=3154458 RepID=UPI0033AB7E21
MSFAIIADLPLGVYRGHVGEGDLDVVVSPARLHAALVCAAAAGPRAVQEGGRLLPCAQDDAALRWLELHPPDGIRLPRRWVNTTAAVAFRDEGLLKKSKSGWAVKKNGKPAAVSVAADGVFAWVWREAPPPPVRAALTELCADVSHLGMAECPARVWTGTGEAVQPSHVWDTEASLFSGSGAGVDVVAPAPGRGAVLAAGHAAMVAAVPSVKADAIKTDEQSVRAPVDGESLQLLRYVPCGGPVSTAPWSTVWLAPLDKPVEPDERVAWAVAVHRALISIIGDGAPGVVTGAYPRGVPRPANRIAIQFLDVGMPFACATSAPSTVAVLLPSDAAEMDVRVIGEALARLRVIRLPGGEQRAVVGQIEVTAGEDFWHPPRPGLRRWWITAPAAVADNRPPRGAWSVADTVAASVGLVWRDMFPVTGRSDARYRALAQAVGERGVRVSWASLITSGNLRRFVHKVQPGAVVQPYRALLSLGSVAGERTLVAIGQSRHLGGGLLTPVDLPAEEAAQ